MDLAERAFRKLLIKYWKKAWKDLIEMDYVERSGNLYSIPFFF